MSNKLKNTIYIALAQFILTYCISIWRGANKTYFLDLKRAQRSLIKVMYSKPLRFPTKSLYRISGLLSVRKPYVLNIVLQCHKSLTYVKPTRRRIKDIIVLIIQNTYSLCYKTIYCSVHLRV